MDNCGPGNILRELAKRVDRKELEQVKTENAHLTTQVAAMAQEPSQKNEEIRKYHAGQAVVFNQIRKMLGHPAEIVNKAHLYDRMMASAELASAKQGSPHPGEGYPDDERPFARGDHYRNFRNHVR